MFEHRRHVEVLAKAGVPFTSVALSGGGARIPLWPQKNADGLGVPVATAEARETGALGAAIGAGLGAGIFASYEAGVSAMTRVKRIHEPDPVMCRHFDRRYALYGRLTEALQPFWEELGALGPVSG